MKLADWFFLDDQTLAQRAQQHRAAYGAAQPFPHVVFDDLVPPWLLDEVLAEFPVPGASAWHGFENPRQKKLAGRAEEHMGPATRLLLYQLNSAPFLLFLEQLTGLDGLIPDPHFGGGGLHQIERGGFLKVHADFNRHPTLHLDRRLNLLLYLNKDWPDSYGGHLELWSRDMRRCERRILPLFNRCVVFTTTDTSYHGHPDPLTCPPGRTRKSLALYYYTQNRPEAERFAPHSTLFRERPGEQVPGAARPSAAGARWRRFVPPVVFDAWRYLKKRHR